MLVRRIILGIILLGVAGLAYVGYKSWMAKRAMMGGEVYSDTIDSVGTTLKQAAAAPASSGSGSTTPTTSTQGQPTANPQTMGQSTAQAYPAPAGALTGRPATTDPNTTQTASNQVSSNQTASADTNDSIRPNPPNGTVYAGTGHYQVYRQGNLTWRLNTDTGRACVLFATEEEWHKPQVYRNGCASSASR